MSPQEEFYRDSHQTFFNFINYHLGIRDMKYHR